MRKIGGSLRDGTFSKTENGKELPYVVFEIRQKDFLTGPLSHLIVVTSNDKG